MSDILAIDHFPESIPCWYCGEPCPNEWDKWDGSQRVEYRCSRHPPLDVEVTCVRQSLDRPWFFNRIAVTDLSSPTKLQLHWNYYSGDRVHLRYIPKKQTCHTFVAIQNWPPIWQTYPSTFLNQTPDKLIKFFKLYRTFC